MSISILSRMHRLTLFWTMLVLPPSPYASPPHCLIRTIVLHLPPSILQFSFDVVYILRDSIRDSVPDTSNNRLRTLRRHVPSLLPPRNKPRKNNNPPPQELRLVRLRRPPERHHLAVRPARGRLGALVHVCRTGGPGVSARAVAAVL